MNKICSKCNLDKELESFSPNKDGKNGKASICKQCNRERYHKNKDTIALKRKEIYNQNKDEINKQKRIRYETDEIYRNEILKRGTVVYYENGDEKISYAKAYQNKPENKIKRNKREKKRRQEDLQYKITTNIRNRIGYFFKYKEKNESSIKMLGCTIQDLISYIESLFQPGMTWDNYGSGPGKWEIDHIKALCLFDLKESDQYVKACHYTNLQPL